MTTSPIGPSAATADRRPILIIPYMWIGDFVRCHSVVTVLKERFPERPVDLLATALTAPLARFMPGVRNAIVSDLPRGAVALAAQRSLARRLVPAGYGTALVMPRTWKSALAPFLARIPERVGWFGEGRLLLLNDIRRGEKTLPRMVDRCAALALAPGAPAPAAWPEPRLVAPPSEVAAFRQRRGLDGGRPVAALAPGAVGATKRWPLEGYGALAAALADRGIDVWVLGGPGERDMAQSIAAAANGRVIDMTGDPLDEAVLAFAAADVAICNDSGLLHVAAAAGTPSIGLFGPTDPEKWAPLNPLAATLHEDGLDCRPCHKMECPLGHHRCMTDLDPARVLDAVSATLARGRPRPAQALVTPSSTRA